MESTVLELLAAAPAERRAKLDDGRVDTVFVNQIMPWTKKLLGGWMPGCCRHWFRPRRDGPLSLRAARAPVPAPKRRSGRCYAARPSLSTD